jgi:hypothetical protein
MFALLSHPDGSPIVIAGPCWPFCVFVTRTSKMQQAISAGRGGYAVFIVVSPIASNYFGYAVPLILGISALVAYFVIIDNDRFDLVRAPGHFLATCATLFLFAPLTPFVVKIPLPAL